MKIFTSLNGALALSFAHLLIELWRALLDFSFTFPNFTKSNESQMLIASLVYVAMFAIWMLGLRNAGSGNRGRLIAALVVGILFLLGIDLGTILFYCPGGCSHAAFNIAAWVGAIVGLLAVVALAMVIRRRNQTDAVSKTASV